MNLKTIWNGFTSTFTETASLEVQLVRLFLAEPQTFVTSLTNYFNDTRQEHFRKVGPRDYHSDRNMVRVCNDIYGCEVKIGSVDELLDCMPDAYGLTKEQAMGLYNAILSNVPGTCASVDKLNRKLEVV